MHLMLACWFLGIKLKEIFNIWAFSSTWGQPEPAEACVTSRLRKRKCRESSCFKQETPGCLRHVVCRCQRPTTRKAYRAKVTGATLFWPLEPGLMRLECLYKKDSFSSYSCFLLAPISVVALSPVTTVLWILPLWPRVSDMSKMAKSSGSLTSPVFH